MINLGLVAENILQVELSKIPIFTASNRDGHGFSYGSNKIEDIVLLRTESFDMNINRRNYLILNSATLLTCYESVLRVHLLTAAIVYDALAQTIFRILD